jgi:hypothetical protein
LQREAGGFINFKNLPVRSPPVRPQAGRKTSREEDGEKKRRRDFERTGEEDGAERR